MSDPKCKCSDPDQAIQQAREKALSLALYARGDRAFHDAIDALISASRASLEEEIKRLTKELHDMGDNRDKWKAQCEANSEELTRLVAEAALQSRASQHWQPEW